MPGRRLEGAARGFARRAGKLHAQPGADAAGAPGARVPARSRLRHDGGPRGPPAARPRPPRRARARGPGLRRGAARRPARAARAPDARDAAPRRMRAPGRALGGAAAMLAALAVAAGAPAGRGPGPPWGRGAPKAPGGGTLARSLHHFERCRALFEERHGSPDESEPWIWHQMALEGLVQVATDMRRHDEALEH